MKQLLDAGAKPELQTFLGDTPSSLAYSSNHTAVASLLDGVTAGESNAVGPVNHVHDAQQSDRGGQDRPDDDIETHQE